MAHVPIKRTPVSMSEYATALLKAWRAELGELPSKQSAGALWAQYMIETGGAACWCWNLGNVKVTQAQVDADVDWFDLPGTWEMIAGHRVVLPEGHPGRRFRAYASLPDAMTEHLQFLRNRRYKVAWPAVLSGDVMDFARRLKAAGYFTASAEDYGGGMMWHYRRWLGSTTYENARDQIEMLQEAPTKPEVENPDSEPTMVIHPTIEFPVRKYDPEDDEEPDPAA